MHYTYEHTSCANYHSREQGGFQLMQLCATTVLTQNDNTTRAHQIFFILEGKMSLRINDKQVLLENNLLFFIPALKEFELTTLTACKLISLAFFYERIRLCDKHLLEHYMKAVPEVKPNLYPLAVSKPLDLYLQLLEVYLSEGINCHHLHEIKEKELFLLLRTTYSKLDVVQLLHPIMGNNIDFKAKVMKLKDRVSSRGELADKLALSLSDFDRKFKSEFGETAHTWLQKEKNLRITTLLSDPSLKIKDVVHELNFSSTANFNKYCHRNFGCSPKELKKYIRAKIATTKDK